MKIIINRISTNDTRWPLDVETKDDAHYLYFYFHAIEYYVKKDR